MCMCVGVGSRVYQVEIMRSVPGNLTLRSLNPRQFPDLGYISFKNDDRSG